MDTCTNTTKLLSELLNIVIQLNNNITAINNELQYIKKYGTYNLGLNHMDSIKAEKEKYYSLYALFFVIFMAIGIALLLWICGLCLSNMCYCCCEICEYLSKKQYNFSILPNNNIDNDNIPLNPMNINGDDEA